tara:strand:- start:105 stop:530 length:426 start_codon:yes stop_codon:yes gene_type:complete
MIDIIKKENLKQKQLDFIIKSLSESKQVSRVDDVKDRILQVYVITKNKKIIAFSCNKTSLLKRFDIELGYTWVDPNFRGNIYCVKLLNFQIKDIKDKNIKAYSVNNETNRVMVKYSDKNKLSIFAKTHYNNKNLQWRIINK